MYTKCPICDKSGLPDYTNIHTVCPQCNSDLKAFMLLHSIDKPKYNKKFLFIFVVVSTIGLVFVILYFNSLLENGKLESEIKNKVETIQDSLQTLYSAISHNKTKISDVKIPENEIIIQYKVKSGDNLSKIAQFFYNDWKMYRQIETDNNLTQPYILKVGQMLKIKIKK